MNKYFHFIFLFILIIFGVYYNVYAWKHPEKTHRQIVIELFNKKNYTFGVMNE